MGGRDTSRKKPVADHAPFFFFIPKQPNPDDEVFESLSELQPLTGPLRTESPHNFGDVLGSGFDSPLDAYVGGRAGKWIGPVYFFFLFTFFFFFFCPRGFDDSTLL